MTSRSVLVGIPKAFDISETVEGPLSDRYTQTACSLFEDVPFAASKVLKNCLSAGPLLVIGGLSADSLVCRRVIGGNCLRTGETHVHAIAALEDLDGYALFITNASNTA